MRKFAAAVAVVAGLAAVPAAASAASVTGLGLTGTAPQNVFSLNATDSGGASGTVALLQATNSSKQIYGTVTCLTVSGNQAFMVYQDAPGTTSATPGTVGGVVQVEDNGPATIVPVDRMRSGRVTQTKYDALLAANCPIPAKTPKLITAGEITVTP